MRDTDRIALLQWLQILFYSSLIIGAISAFFGLKDLDGVKIIANNIQISISSKAVWPILGIGIVGLAAFVSTISSLTALINPPYALLADEFYAKKFPKIVTFWHKIVYILVMGTIAALALYLFVINFKNLIFS